MVEMEEEDRGAGEADRDGVGRPERLADGAETLREDEGIKSASDGLRARAERDD